MYGFVIAFSIFMLQSNATCQEKAVEQTFVVDSSRLLSFAVGYISDYKNISFSRFILRILKDIMQIFPFHQFNQVKNVVGNIGADDV